MDIVYSTKATSTGCREGRSATVGIGGNPKAEANALVEKAHRSALTPTQPVTMSM